MCQSILPTIAQPLSRLKPASTLWRTLETMYANKTNISHTVEIFESMFTCTQGDQSLQDHFGRLQSLVQELSLYQPPTKDLRTLERYREELIAGVYLSGLRPFIASQIRGQVLSGTQVPDMTSIFSSALRVSTGVTLSARVTSSIGPSSSTSSSLPESSACWYLVLVDEMGGVTPRLLLLAVDGPLLRASKSSRLALIVARPLMLQRSAGRSLGSLNGLKLCFPLLLQARLHLIYLRHRSDQLYK